MSKKIEKKSKNGGGSGHISAHEHPLVQERKKNVTAPTMQKKIGGSV
jgi:hypothetical protein